MTNKYAVLVASIFPFFLRFSLFISPPISSCAIHIGNIPSFIILISMCFLIMDMNLFNVQYNQKFAFVFYIVEAILSLLVIEVVMFVIWSRIEEYIVTLIKFMLSRGNLYQEMGGDSFTGFLVSGLAICFLLFTIKATKSSEEIVYIMYGIKEKIENFEFNFRKTSEVSQTQQHCQIVKIQCPVTVSSLVRHPQCPIHGDAEVNQQRTKIPRSRRS